MQALFPSNRNPFSSAHILLHAEYAPREQKLLRIFRKAIETTHEMYLDWWLHWIRSAPIPVRYVADADLLFSHPVAFCKLMLDNEENLIAFDLWDKYPVFANHHTSGPDVKARWRQCRVCFKTNYFDIASPFRYRAPLGYVPRDKDAGRKAAEQAYYADNIYPCGMPTLHGFPFLKGRYKKWRRSRRNIDLNSSGQRQGSPKPIRHIMVDKLENKYPLVFSNSYKEYLHRLGRTNICIDFPSNSRVTFRSSESLAMGALLIGPPVCNIYPPGFTLENLMVVCRPDISDIEDKIEFFLTNEDERRRLAEKAMRCWDRVMAPEPLSAYWIKTCLDRM